MLELNEHEPPYGHPLMPYVASVSDMFCCHFWFELDFPKMFLLFLKEQTSGVVSILWPLGRAPQEATETWDYGWEPVDRIWDSGQEKIPGLATGSRSFSGRQFRETGYKLTSTFGDDTVI